MNILLDSLCDFQNICSISRSMEFFWKKECYIFDPNNLVREKYGKSYKRKLRWVSAWAFEKIKFIKIDNPIDFLKEYNWRKIATVLSDNSEKSFDFKFLENDLVIFWNEVNWISKEVLDLCEVFIKIPSYWITQSLNVSHSVSIILYEEKRAYL